MSQMERNQQVLINIVAELRAKFGEKECSHQDVDSDINIPISPVDEALDTNLENESPKVSKYLYKGCYLKVSPSSLRFDYNFIHGNLNSSLVYA